MITMDEIKIMFEIVAIIVVAVIGSTIGTIWFGKQPENQLEELKPMTDENLTADEQIKQYLTTADDLETLALAMPDRKDKLNEEAKKWRRKAIVIRDKERAGIIK